MIPDGLDKRSIFKEGDPEKIFFLPFIGEFGAYLTTYVHDIYRIQAEEKVVAIRPKHKILFPTATEFFYDWDIFVDDIRRDGVNRTGGPIRVMTALMHTIIEEYPQYKDYTFISPFGRYDSRYPMPYSGFELERLTDIDIWPHICICTRNRQKSMRKNMSKEYWESLISQLPKYKIANVGDRDTSINDLKVTYNSWDYHYGFYDINASINIMQNSKLVVTTNTGGLHLANLCGKDIILLYNAKGMLEHVRAIMKNNRIIVISKEKYKDTELVAKVIKTYFKHKNTKIIAEGVDDWGDFEKTIEL